jgi:small membrane protein
MTGIQIILISGIIFLSLYFIFRLRSAILDMTIVISFSTLGILFILMPTYTNVIATKLGVGRGADLVFYICILFFSFIVLKLFAKLRRLEQTITELIRQQAKREAKFLDSE